MANKREYVRRLVPVTPTAQNAGLKINLEIGDYDNGMFTINGDPIGPMDDRGLAMSAVNRLICQALEELVAASIKRKREQAA